LKAVFNDIFGGRLFDEEFNKTLEPLKTFMCRCYEHSVQIIHHKALCIDYAVFMQFIPEKICQNYIFHVYSNSYHVSIYKDLQRYER
jgi:hypothetical protein